MTRKWLHLLWRPAFAANVVADVEIPSFSMQREKRRQKNLQSVSKQTLVKWEQK
jgi:hypothetical protein